MSNAGSFSRRVVLFGGALSLALTFSLFVFAAHAQDYPNKQIRIVVPYAAGGSVDALARMIGEGLHNKWKQTVTVEIRIGAGGNIGSENVFRSAPDGYTLLV